MASASAFVWVLSVVVLFIGLVMLVPAGMRGVGRKAILASVGMWVLSMGMCAVGVTSDRPATAQTTGTSGDTGAPQPVSAPADDQKCMEDIKCWGEKHLIAAGVQCDDYVERLAKFDHKWTDGFLEPKFSHYRWHERKEATVTYIGDKIQFQNGFGAFQNHIYECDYDPAAKKVLDIRARPGRLR